MRILWLFWNGIHNDSIGISRRLHYGLISKLGELPDIELVIYGPGNTSKTELTPVPYGSHIAFPLLVNRTKPDIILLYSKVNVIGWLPKKFEESKIPKVMIECDWWNVGDKSWYKEKGINLFIQRGSVKTDIKEARSVWLPFSVAEEDFIKYQSIPLKDRKRRIGFVGRGSGRRYRNAGVYQNRFQCIFLLLKRKLIEVVGQVGHKEYPENVSKFFCCFSDCGRLSSPPGKTFEIMGSGSLLLTDPFIGKEYLFGDKEVCKFYNSNRRNLVRVVNEIMKSDVNKLQEIVNTAVSEINRKHLDKHRVLELEQILRSYLKGGRVDKRWGI